MIYKATITSGAELNITRTILQLDEFLKEYWGTEVYQIKTSSGILRNTDVFELGMKLSKEYVSFYCFQGPEDYHFLQEHNYSRTLAKTEIFCFTLTANYLEVCFYNSLETNERERQFYKIVDNIKTALKADIPLLRTQRVNKDLADVMFKYRRSEGKIVFRLVPSDNIDDFKTYDSIFIYWSDFAYLRPFIYQVYPQRKENREDGFDDTSWNKGVDAYIKKFEGL